MSEVQSVDRAAQILQLLSAESPLSVSEISRRLQVHRSTASRLMATLETHDLVEQEGQRGAYRLGFGLLRLASAVTARVDLSRDAQACCDAAAASLNETVNVAILDAGYAVTITQTVGQRMVGVARQYVGQRAPLHATSTGKVLLACSPAAEQEQVLAAPLEAFTASTITSPKVLAAELAAVRARGWASAVAEWEEGINALAVPVRGPQGVVVAAFSTTAPAFRLPESAFAEHVQMLREAAGQLESRLGYLPGPRESGG
ncbi:IclR family transcriptional regulator [Nesterenkonia aurantiaca]|uniref:IclR family transcriptional regulator n=1 Tax=Nesterenkonia aurantiaca TaxID=1436010 RepID=UPI003EE55B7D